MTLEQHSKFLSYILRHKPEAAKLTLDKNGWADVQTILNNSQLTMELLAEIVATDAKGRYSFSEDRTLIRANQGHSTSTVDVTFKKAVPPVTLYHGTPTSSVKSILKQGLLKMSRHHVHLSADEGTAVNVGSRRRQDVTVLRVDAKRMLEDKFEFFISTNGVWLIEHVPAKYISIESTN